MVGKEGIAVSVDGGAVGLADGPQDDDASNTKIPAANVTPIGDGRLEAIREAKLVMTR